MTIGLYTQFVDLAPTVCVYLYVMLYIGKENAMSNAKQKMTEVIQSQPDDATYEEIMRELAFERMVARGLEDSRAGKVVSNEEMERRIRTWKK